MRRVSSTSRPWGLVWTFSLLNAVRNHPQSAYGLTDVYADYISDAVARRGARLRAARGTASTTSASASGRARRSSCATAVAAKTERLRVGTAVVAAAVPRPAPRRRGRRRSADILSGGRFDLGIGPGSQYEEFRDVRRRPQGDAPAASWESIDWIRRGFDEKDEFSHQGQYYDIPDMTFTTKPVQNPVPGLVRAAMGPRNQAKAAERGFNFIGPFNPGYDAAARRRPAVTRSTIQVASMQVVCVADDGGAGVGDRRPRARVLRQLLRDPQGPRRASRRPERTRSPRR